MRLIACFSLILCACDSNTTNNNTGEDLSGVASDGGDQDLSGAITCGLVGESCADNSACCSNNCDTTTNICLSGTAMCKPQGSSCTLPTECCTLTCNGGTCGAACTADNAACTDNAACCSGQCVNNSCKPLNTMCLTSGNPCNNGDGGATGGCCSTLCKNGTCSISASYCTQVGDVCYQGPDCCTGVCNKAAGALAGVCGTLNSPVSCKIDGTLCAGCGDCCSRLCAPYATSGVDICQPASGCHVYGDLCRKDSDCCGGESPDAGLPGAGRVKCTMIAGTGGLGYCDHPTGGQAGNACNPEGNVCHFKDYAGQCANSSERNDCCACIASKDCCKVDPIGIPRCQGIGGDGGAPCVPAGGNCTFNGNCCENLPCVPDSTGQLKCGVGTDGGSCVPAGGPCTTTGDCCTGVTCVVPPGALVGTCENIVPPDGGVPICAEIGQSCETYACCVGLTCSNNMGPCGATGAGCICTTVVP